MKLNVLLGIFDSSLLKTLLTSSNFQFGVKSAKSLVKEFDTFVRLDLACILDEEDNCESAAEVKWTLDNLIAAYNARMDLETYGPRIAFVKG